MKHIKILIISTVLTLFTINSYSEEKVDCSTMETNIKKSICNMKQGIKNVGSFVSDQAKKSKEKSEEPKKKKTLVGLITGEDSDGEKKSIGEKITEKKSLADFFKKKKSD